MKSVSYLEGGRGKGNWFGLTLSNGDEKRILSDSGYIKAEGGKGREGKGREGEGVYSRNIFNFGISSHQRAGRGREKLD